MRQTKRLQGFTLVEMIIVIVISGIIAGMVAVFIRMPVQGYFDTVRRAELSEEADAALRFLARDLQSALPNSISCGTDTLSFMSVRSGGRYRESPQGDGTGVPLQFGVAVTNFDTIGGGSDSTSKDAQGNPASGSVVVGNLSPGAGICNALSPADNIAALNGTPGATVAVTGANFPAACQLQSATATDNAATASVDERNDREFGRFFVVNPTPITYACSTAAGLTRDGVALASHATGANRCNFLCDGTNARVQTITARLTLSNSGEEVQMLRQIRVLNLP